MSVQIQLAIYQDKNSDIHSIWSSKKNRRIILSLNFIQGGTYFKISADDN